MYKDVVENYSAKQEWMFYFIFLQNSQVASPLSTFPPVEIIAQTRTHTHAHTRTHTHTRAHIHAQTHTRTDKESERDNIRC